MKQEPKRTRPTKLQMLETKLISMEECQQMVIDPEATKIYPTEICAFHSNGTGACNVSQHKNLHPNNSIYVDCCRCLL